MIGTIFLRRNKKPLPRGQGRCVVLLFGGQLGLLAWGQYGNKAALGVAIPCQHGTGGKARVCLFVGSGKFSHCLPCFVQPPIGVAFGARALGVARYKHVHNVVRVKVCHYSVPLQMRPAFAYVGRGQGLPRPKATIPPSAWPGRRVAVYNVKQRGAGAPAMYVTRYNMLAVTRLTHSSYAQIA